MRPAISTKTLTSEDKVDQWFEAKTKGLTESAKAEAQEALGNDAEGPDFQVDGLEKIVKDIVFDMETRDRLMSGNGQRPAGLAATSTRPASSTSCSASRAEGQGGDRHQLPPYHGDIAKDDPARATTRTLRKYDTYRKMLADYFDEPDDKAVNRVEEFEDDVKEKFVKEPGQMKLLIVVDKLLTGFDAPRRPTSTSTSRCATTACSRPSAASIGWTAKTKNTATSSTTERLFKTLEESRTATTRPGLSTATTRRMSRAARGSADKARQEAGGLPATVSTASAIRSSLQEHP